MKTDVHSRFSATLHRAKIGTSRPSISAAWKRRRNEVLTLGNSSLLGNTLFATCHDEGPMLALSDIGQGLG